MMDLLKYLNEKPLFSLFLGVVVLSLGMVIFKLPMVIASVRWPTSEGVIISSEVEEAESISEDGLPDRAYWPRVSYRYSVNGRWYTSNRIEVMDFGSADIWFPALQVVQRYPVGERVQVYFKPDNPAIAVLEPGIPDDAGGGSDVFFGAAVIAVIGVGVICLCVGLFSILGRIT